MENSLKEYKLEEVWMMMVACLVKPSWILIKVPNEVSFRIHATCNKCQIIFFFFSLSCAHSSSFTYALNTLCAHGVSNLTQLQFFSFFSMPNLFDPRCVYEFFFLVQFSSSFPQRTNQMSNSYESKSFLYTQRNTRKKKIRVSAHVWRAQMTQNEMTEKERNKTTRLDLQNDKMLKIRKTNWKGKSLFFFFHLNNMRSA